MNIKILYCLFLGLFAFTSIKSNAQVKETKHHCFLADDTGYSDIGCFGSETKTLNLDEMAAKGLKMTQLYNASRCCPTKASLITELYQHQAGDVDMMNTRKEPACQGYLNKNNITITEVLQGDWKFVSRYPDNEWYLFNMLSYRTELNYLSKTQTKKVQELIAL